LFHDAGLMLCHPPMRSPGTDLPQGTAEVFAEVVKAANSSGASLLETCVRDLKAFDASLMTDVVEWCESQDAEGRPDHALVSAWYLMKVCEETKLERSVLTAAVRAILLHGAVANPIDLSRDPNAALLVLCDEICDWYPVHPRMQSGAGGGALNAKEWQPRRDGQRARDVGLHGFWGAAERGVLITGVAPPEGVADGSPPRWPLLSIRLRAPSELSASVLEIWLCSAQNLGRISRSTEWAPCITMANNVPPRLAVLGSETKAFFEELVQAEQLTELQDWLERAVFERDVATGVESVQLWAGETLGPPEDIARRLPDILTKATFLLSKKEQAAMQRELNSRPK
jgi:hypothetical protein